MNDAKPPSEAELQAEIAEHLRRGVTPLFPAYYRRIYGELAKRINWKALREPQETKK